MKVHLTGTFLAKVDCVSWHYDTGNCCNRSNDDAQTTLSRLVADGQTLTPDTLNLPSAAEEVGSAIFGDTFFDGAGHVVVDGILSVGQKVPCIGAIFSILKDLKENLHQHIEAEEECRRLSVWCTGMIATIGHLGREATIDKATNDLLRAAIPPLLDLKKLVMARRDASSGYLNTMINFWTGSEYLRRSSLAQQRVKSAIEALSLRVQFNTQIDVQRMLKKCENLPAMDKKLDAMDSKLDRIQEGQQQLLEATRAKAAKQTVREKTKERKRTNMDKYNIASSNIRIDAEPFASGANASVYKAKWQGIVVAVKATNLGGLPLHAREDATERFLAETDILVGFRHPNILNVYGVITDNLLCFQHVLEFADAGDLSDFLGLSSDALPAIVQLDLSAQIARGMCACHEHRVAHRDLKSLNVLTSHCSVDAHPSGRIAKIADFGASKDVSATTGTASNIGTPAWTAPEILEMKEGADIFSADVYSYGVTVFEIASRQLPWNGLQPMQILMKVCMQNERVEMPASAPPVLVQVANACLEKQPSKRPTFEKIQDILDTACETEMSVTRTDSVPTEFL